MNLPTIRNVARRVWRGDTTYVIYKVALSDGRMLRFDQGFNADLTDSEALTGSRKDVEDKLFAILTQEVSTGRYHCCHGTMPRHTDDCRAA